MRLIVPRWLAARPATTLLLVAVLTTGEGAAQRVANRPAGALDTVRLVDGGERRGTLTACIGGTCQMEGAAPIARRDIAAIGFGRNAPASARGDEDVVIFAESPSRSLAVYGVSPIDIVTAAGPFARPDVAGIVFARLPASEPLGADVVPNSTDVGPAPAPPARPPTASTPRGGSTPPTGSNPPTIDRLRVRPDGSIENGALWIGMIRGAERQAGSYPVPYSHFYRVAMEVRLREVSARRLGLDEYEIGLRNEGTKITSDAALSSGCNDRRSFDLTDTDFSNESTIRYTGTAPAASAGSDATREGVAMFQFIAPQNWVACEGTPIAAEGLFHGLGHNNVAIGMVPWDLDGKARPLIENRSRFRGQMRYELPESQWDFRWDICRQGNDNCRPLPDFEPCARSGQGQALADLCEQQLQALSAALQQHQQEFDQLWNDAEANMGAYVRAIAACKLFNKVQEVLEGILTANAGSLGKTGEAVELLRKVMQATANGDLKDLLIPENMKKVLDAMGDIGDFASMFSSDAVSLMTSELDNCSGKALVDDMLKARKFLENVAAAMDLYRREVAPRMNDIRTKVLECQYLKYKASLARDPACLD